MDKISLYDLKELCEDSLCEKFNLSKELSQNLSEIFSGITYENLYLYKVDDAKNLPDGFNLNKSEFDTLSNILNSLKSSDECIDELRYRSHETSRLLARAAHTVKDIQKHISYKLQEQRTELSCFLCIPLVSESMESFSYYSSFEHLENNKLMLTLDEIIDSVESLGFEIDDSNIEEISMSLGFSCCSCGTNLSEEDYKNTPDGGEPICSKCDIEHYGEWLDYSKEQLDKFKLDEKFEAIIRHDSDTTGNTDRVLTLRKGEDGHYIGDGSDEVSFVWNIVKLRAL